jgi:hypothetical protein
MPVEDLLSQFRDAYFSAGDARGRIAAIRRFRADPSALPAQPEPGELARIFEMLLHYARHDTEEARAEAACILYDIWVGLSDPARQPLFHDFTALMLEHPPTLAGLARYTLRRAILYGCERADAGQLERLCRELTQQQVRRSLGLPPAPGTWRGAACPPPDMEVLHLIVCYAPAQVWPCLVGDLWRLYNLDLERAESLAREAGLAMNGVRVRVVLRRTACGTEERLGFCWELARSLLERTLREARPDDLGTAASGFFAWLAALSGMPEAVRSPLLPLLAAWTAPPVLPVLERWSRETHNPWFQRRVRQAIRTLRSSLGLGPEVVPARAPHSTGHEAVPDDVVT